jgi:hypothetical protein
MWDLRKDVQGTFREHSGSTFREHSGNIQGTLRKLRAAEGLGVLDGLHQVLH